ncbi:MAG: hypothetical protein ACPGU5_00885 [Lishizhenia sp.]
MKISLYILSFLILTSCASTSFHKRKYLDGKFRVPKAALLSTPSKKEKENKLFNTKLEEIELTEIEQQSNSKPKTASANPVDYHENKDIANDFKSINTPKLENSKLYQDKNHFVQPSFDDTVFVDADSFEGEACRKAKNKGTTSLILGILSFFPFPLTTLIFSIIGISLAKASLRSRFQTEVGRRNAKIGKVLSIISLSLLIAAILLVITLLFVFGF